ncbi:MAG: SH3 domain-containing protein, partial [Anaerolineales bacterium]
DPVGGLLDGAQVEILSGPVDYNGDLWWQIRTTDGEVGWILAGYVQQVTGTPAALTPTSSTGTTRLTPSTTATQGGG